MILNPIYEQASRLYSNACIGLTVAPNGDRWDVFDGPDGPLIDTVDAAVLQAVNDNYDMPIRTSDGSLWPAP